MLDLSLFADTVPPSFSADQVGALIVAVMIALGGGGVVGRLMGKREGVETGKAQAMLIANQPLSVKMEEQFVTRREFERLEASVSGTVTKMEGLFAQTMQAIEAQAKQTERRIENQNKRLTVTIESVAQAANAGRGKLWKKVNEEAEKLATVKAEGNVAKELGKLGDALLSTAATTAPTSKQLS